MIPRVLDAAASRFWCNLMAFFMAIFCIVFWWFFHRSHRKNAPYQTAKKRCQSAWKINPYHNTKKQKTPLKTAKNSVKTPLKPQHKHHTTTTNTNNHKKHRKQHNETHDQQPHRATQPTPYIIQNTQDHTKNGILYRIKRKAYIIPCWTYAVYYTTTDTNTKHTERSTAAQWINTQ